MSVLSDITTPVRSTVARRFLDIVAAGDSAALLDLFAPTAVVRDWGHAHVGREAIADWNEREFLGATVGLDVTRVVEIDDRVTVTAFVRSPSFSGPSTFALVISNDQLKELLISA